MCAGDQRSAVCCEINGIVGVFHVSGDFLTDLLQAAGEPVNIGCEEGICGSCLVRLNGELVHSCTVLAQQAEGGRVCTARGLAGSQWGGVTGAVDAIRAALSAEGGLQCGYCTPGVLLTLHQLWADGQVRTEPQLRSALAGSVCRCTGYTGIVRAGLRVPAGAPPWQRLEDDRLTAGRGCFTSSLSRPGQLYARVVRGGRAGVRLEEVDVTAARRSPGVVDVLTAADLPPACRLLLVPEPDQASSELAPEPVLATTEVRYVGQPVAVVLAENSRAAEDAAETVRLEYGPALPPPVTVAVTRAGAADGRGPVLQEYGDVEDGFRAATVVLDEDFAVQRQTGVPLEPRALLAEWDPVQPLLTVWGATKQPYTLRDRIASSLGLEPAQVHLPAVDVGGAFGVRGELYPEDLLVPLAAMRTGRPVAWLEDRAEHLVAINHSRDQRWRVRLAADATGRLLAAEVEIDNDAGAYQRPLTHLMPLLATAMFPGPYRIPAYRAVARSTFSFKTPTGPLRAPGRFEANFVRERALDLLAQRCAAARTELRTRNLLTAADLPYDTGTVNEGPVVYDVGDFRRLFADTCAAFESPSARLPDDGLLRGSAVVPYVEKSSLGAPEVATAALGADGRVRIEAASAPSGQGHETAWAMLTAEVLGVTPGEVEVRCGDTAGRASGLGTFASRGAVMTGNAVHAAALALRDRVCELTRRQHGLGRQPLLLRAGQVCAQDGARITDLAAIAALARPEDVRVSAEFAGQQHTYPHGAVGCAVAVDPELCTVRVERLLISCDAGRVLHEGIVRGQLAGGLVQGIGAALAEELRYDQDGQPQVHGLGDYLVPLADDVPDVHVMLVDRTRPESNPLGVKGIGECGTAAAAAALAAAVTDAVPQLNHGLRALPLHPARLWAALNHQQALA